MPAIALLAATASPATGAEPTLDRPVVWFMLHGAKPADVERLVSTRRLPRAGSLATLARASTIRQVVPTDPALTSSGRISTLTGTTPAVHGVVGNSFRRSGDLFDAGASGFGTPFQAEAIWQAAERQGREVIRIGSLFAAGSAADVGDAALLVGQPFSPSRVTSLRPASSGPAETAERAVLLTDGETASMRLGSSADNGRHRLVSARAIGSGGAFDRVALEADGNRLATLRPGQWAAIDLPGEGPRAGLWIKLTALDPSTGAAKLFVGAGHQGRGYPTDFLAEVEARIGFYPGTPDFQLQRQGDIDDATFVEQVERENAYLRDAAIAAAKLRPFSLMLVEQPALDSVAHEFMLEDPKQAGFADAARRARNAGHIDRGYQLVDANLSAVGRAVPSAVVVASSDYALVPAHTRYDVNALLAGAGFRVTSDDTAEVRARASSTSAHVYINQKAVASPAHTDLLQRIARVLRDFRHTATGEPVFEEVLLQEEQQAKGLFMAGASGDIWVRARPGFTLNAQRDRFDTLVDAPFLPGEHGYAPRPDTYGLLLMSCRTPALSTVVPATDLVHAVSALLGTAPPADARPASFDTARLRQDCQAPAVAKPQDRAG